MDAKILLVIVHLTKMCTKVCSRGLIFIWEQSMFWNIQPTYCATIHWSL